MRRTTRTALLFLALVALAGCATEAARLRTAADAYATTLRVLADYRRAGRIDDAEAAQIEDARVAARAALDSWRGAVEAGGSNADAAQRFNEALDALIDARLKAEGRRHERN